MFTLPLPIQEVLAAFLPLFTQRTWQQAQILILGAVLARGKRTVTAALRVMGLAGERRFTNFHRVLNRAVWHTCFAAKILLGLLVKILPPGAPLHILVDETIERRKGDKIKTKGVFRDAVRSSRSKVVHCYGLRWVAMMLIVVLPWSNRPWALPFFTVQAPSQKTCQKLNKRHKSVIDLVCQGLRLVRRWFPARTLVLVGDGAYAAIDLIQFCSSQANPITLVARFRWNALLYDLPAPPIPGKRGRKPQKGKRLPSLKQLLVDPATIWETILVRWYDGAIKELLVFSGVGLWHTPGKSPVLIRWVVVRDPKGQIEDTPILCSDVSATPQQIVEWFVLRWNIEVTFEEVRAHLGVETQRQWSERAISRTTPCLFGLFSLVTLMALAMIKDGRLPISQSAWYQKEHATFSDVISFVRRGLWAGRYFVDSSSEPQSTELFPDILNQLLDALAETA
jgi:hypothetical protein